MEKDPSAEELVRVYLVDDHALIRRGLQDLLDRFPDIEVVGECASAEEAKRAIPVTRPDVAVLDVRLTDGSGIDVCRHLRSTCPSVGVIMLSSFHDEAEVMAAIVAGASGYVLKAASPHGLVDAVRRVAAGQSVLDPVVTSRVLGQVRDGRAGSLAHSRLTTGEMRILGLLAEGLTNRQIAGRLHLSEKTVKNYVSNVLAKLGLQSRTQAAVYAVEHRSELAAAGVG
ncbi:response regulator [Nostocoides sp. F2B08]|nr:response regulator [Tetrasphaera sp. F2B08]